MQQDWDKAVPASQRGKHQCRLAEHILHATLVRKQELNACAVPSVGSEHQRCGLVPINGTRQLGNANLIHHGTQSLNIAFPCCSIQPANQTGTGHHVSALRDAETECSKKMY
jgi:hypothetical protein